ncbi:MAG: hypothetical protein JXA33_13675 [Anaerolineae bacterium]|nr:hypothetical protein [Anaerolineae bacterium]
MMKNASRITASTLGVYAGLLGAVHGYFEILQGNTMPGGLMISAIGPPCRPELATHACFPALTLIPNFLVTGIVALVIGLVAAIWAGSFVQHKRGGVILMLLSVLLLVVGGGFVALFIGLMAGFAGTRIGVPAHQQLSKPRRLLASLWPWPLVAYFVWVFPAQWLLGHFFSTFLLNAILIFFFCFDLGLPLLAVFAGLAYDQKMI